MTEAPRTISMMADTTRDLSGPPRVVITGVCRHNNSWGQVIEVEPDLATDWVALNAYKEFTRSPSCDEHYDMPMGKGLS